MFKIKIKQKLYTVKCLRRYLDNKCALFVGQITLNFKILDGCRSYLKNILKSIEFLTFCQVIQNIKNNIIFLKRAFQINP